MSDWFENVVMWFLTACMIGILITVGVVSYEYYTPEKITIVKANFTCTASHQEFHPGSTIVSGKSIFINPPTWYSVCDQYTRRSAG